MFLATLASTGCLTRAAAACGLSTTALYNRRKAYPDFAGRWDLALADAEARLHSLVVAAGIAALDPEAAEAPGIAKATVSEAIAILKLRGGGRSARSRNVPPEPPIEEVREEVLRRVAAIRRKRERGGPEGFAARPVLPGEFGPAAAAVPRSEGNEGRES
jgi:hypothetical protein